jgi:CRP-like cAMP-binding protein
MVRKLILAKGALLWEEGDHARTIAVVEKGKLGVHMKGRLVGVVNPRMVLGEGSILDVEDRPQPRTARITALEDDTHVPEYPAAMVRLTWESGNPAVGQRILATLAGQTSRNLVLTLAAGRERSLVDPPTRGLLLGLQQVQRAIQDVSRWDEFMNAFRFLYALREASGTIRDLLIVSLPGESEALEKSAEIARQVLKGQDVSLLDDYLAAEREKNAWVDRHGA